MKGTSQRRAFMAQAYLVKSASMAAVSGLVLAGGLGRRMGGVDKGLQLLRGKPMVEWVLERLAPQVGEILINANQNLDQYGKLGHRVVPCDSPFLPPDLVSRLSEQLKDHQVAVARTGDQTHPVFALVRKSLLKNLEAFLAGGGRKIDAWYGSLAHLEVRFDDEADAFRNINTMEELNRE